MYLTKSFSHLILESNSFSIDIFLLTMRIISQKPPFFNISRLFSYFLPQKSKKIKPIKSTYICDFLFSSNSLLSKTLKSSTKILIGAQSGTRTHMVSRTILSRVRLPVPPFGLIIYMLFCILKIAYIFFKLRVKLYYKKFNVSTFILIFLHKILSSAIIIMSTLFLIPYINFLIIFTLLIH